MLMSNNYMMFLLSSHMKIFTHEAHCSEVTARTIFEKANYKMRMFGTKNVERITLFNMCR